MKSLPAALIKHNPLLVFFTLLSVTLAANIAVKAQDELNVIKTRDGWLEYTDAANALYHYLERQSCDLLEKRAAIVAGFHSLSDWQDRQTNVRKILSDIVGPFPERTPLHPKTIRIISKDSYRVEHIVYESQPGFFVTSSLFIPAGLKKNKAPAIIYCSGHTIEGYRSKGYQHIILTRVKKGFIVFAFDPGGQGERLEYYDAESGKSIVGGPLSFARN